MKITACLIAGSVVATSAFAPSPNGARGVTSLEAKPLLNRIFDMDLFAPKKDQNDYGARNSKNVSVGKLGNNSYVPAGLTREEFDKVRKGEAAKKKSNYERNVKKAGVFEDYTEFYIKRGTDTKSNWKKDVNLGHRMAKTKYDWSGDTDKPLWAKKK